MEMNKYVSEQLKVLSTLYEGEGDRYRAMAYGRAAKSVSQLPEPIQSLTNYRVIHGVGESIAGKITELVMTGSCQVLEKMKKKCPPLTITQFRSMHGIGPRGAVHIWKVYGVATLDDLGKAIEEGKVNDLELVKKFKVATAKTARLPLETMQKAVEPVLEKIREIDFVSKAEIAGSIRRQRPAIRDVDIVVGCSERNRLRVIAGLRQALPNAGKGEVKVRGEIRVAGHVRQIDVSVTSLSSWGACMMYLTGSKEHNVLMRVKAKQMGYTLNEYGIWKGEELVASKTEAEIYEALGLKYMEPSEREQWNMTGTERWES